MYCIFFYRVFYVFICFSRLSEVRYIVDNWGIECNEQSLKGPLDTLPPKAFALKYARNSIQLCTDEGMFTAWNNAGICHDY